MTSTESVVQTRRREQWVDTLRVVLICGVIVVHTATAYVTDFAGYYYDDERVSDSAVSIATALPALMGGVFGLGPLFVVAGGSRPGRWRDASGPAMAKLLGVGGVAPHPRVSLADSEPLAKMHLATERIIAAQAVRQSLHSDRDR